MDQIGGASFILIVTLKKEEEEEEALKCSLIFDSDNFLIKTMRLNFIISCITFFSFVKVKIWFQNKRSKFKKIMSKKGGAASNKSKSKEEKSGSSPSESDDEELNDDEDNYDEDMSDNESDSEELINKSEPESIEKSKSDDQIEAHDESAELKTEKTQATESSASSSSSSYTSATSPSISNSLTTSHNSNSLTPPLADSNWSLPYLSNFDSHSHNGNNIYGFSMMQPLSSSSPSYSKLNYHATQTHQHPGAHFQYAQQQQQFYQRYPAYPVYPQQQQQQQVVHNGADNATFIPSVISQNLYASSNMWACNPTSFESFQH